MMNELLLTRTRYKKFICMPFCCLARLIIVTGSGRRNAAPQVLLLRRVEGGLQFVGTNGEEGIQDGEKEKNNRWRKQTRPSTT